MQACHTPAVNARYWLAIALASVFGTNTGDLYAHTSGLGTGAGLGVLAVVAAAVFAFERGDRWTHEAHYWLLILIIRTGATNVADALARRVPVAPAGQVAVIGLVFAALAWRSAALQPRGAAVHPKTLGRLPDTGAVYWSAMLAAGVLGTALGDLLSQAFGQGTASLALIAVLALVLAARRRLVLGGVGAYWFAVAVARTAGTPIGDWLADNERLDLGLSACTLLTGLAFVAVLWGWPAAPPRRRLPP